MDYLDAFEIAGGPEQLKRFLAYRKYMGMRDCYDRKDWIDAFVEDELGDWFRQSLLEKYKEWAEDFEQDGEEAEMREEIKDFFGK